VTSEITAWTPATGPADPRLDGLFRELLRVVFSDSPVLLPNLRGGDDRQQMTQTPSLKPPSMRPVGGFAFVHGASK
jgi:hypothetical protein